MRLSTLVSGTNELIISTQIAVAYFAIVNIFNHLGVAWPIQYHLHLTSSLMMLLMIYLLGRVL